MVKISSFIGKELYKIEIKSATGNTVIADEPLSNGGKDLGFSPKELLISSLAACTSATVRMYADRKGWDLTEVRTEIELEQDQTQDTTFIHRKISFMGNLDEKQKDRLLVVANACPVHKILTNKIEISTTAELG